MYTENRMKQAMETAFRIRDHGLDTLGSNIEYTHITDLPRNYEIPSYSFKTLFQGLIADLHKFRRNKEGVCQKISVYNNFDMYNCQGSIYDCHTIQTGTVSKDFRWDSCLKHSVCQYSSHKFSLTVKNFFLERSRAC